MNKPHRVLRIASVAPASRGFGFAVLDDNALIEWGRKSVESKDKNVDSLKKFEQFLEEFRPQVLTCFDVKTAKPKRAKRIQDLMDAMVAVARQRRIAIRQYSRSQVAESVTGDRSARKLPIAEVVAQTFPDVLLHRLPKKRKPWKSEDPRMDMFDAVALVLTAQIRRESRITKRVANAALCSNPEIDGSAS